MKHSHRFYSISLLAILSLITQFGDHPPPLDDAPGVSREVCTAEELDVTVWFTNVLFEIDVSDHFFVQIGIENGTESDIGVDFRDYWGLIRPVQYVQSDEDQLFVIDICTPMVPELTGEFSADVLKAWNREELVVIPAGETLDYYADFNYGSSEDIKALDTKYLFLGIAGWLAVTDGSCVEILSLDGDFAHYRLSLPVLWDEIPHGSIIAYDHALGVTVEEY
jgi:hypothetical protein